MDPGPTSCLPRLREELAAGGIGIADVGAVLLTHIHLDHAGVTGTLVRENPRTHVSTCTSAAPRTSIDPTKLLSSATRLYGDLMDSLWGEFLAVPAANIVALAGGETIDAGGRRLAVAYTPGHASHHVAYFDPESRVAFVGDVGGAALPGAGFVVPPTPPPDVDVEGWHASADRVLAWHPDTLFLTHFGPHDAPATHLQAMLERLRSWSALARECVEMTATDDDERRDRFVRAITLELRRALPEAQARACELAVPPWQCWLGLERYWRKKTGQ